MKDFQLRNDTKLLLRNNPVEHLAALCYGKNVLFVYGGGSVKTNGSYIKHYFYDAFGFDGSIDNSVKK